MKYLLDTDHISILQWKSEPGFTVLSARLAQSRPDDYGVSLVSLHEQSVGCHAYLNRAKTAETLARGYRMFELILATYSWENVLPFDEAAASDYLALSSQGLRVAAMDLRLAAIARTRNLTLLTRNGQDFAKVGGLAIEDWTH
jgi:tRNA(fMet)-specific endonuclease VapC